MYEQNQSGVYSGYQSYQMPESPQPGRKPGHGKKSGFFKKAVAVIALGAFFGVSAGASFYAVKGFAENGLVQQTEKSEAEDNGKIVMAGSDSAKAEIAVNGKDVANAQTVSAGPQVLDVSGVVKQVMPSVVSITNTYVQTQRDFFGQTLQSEQQASGSGIIVGKSDMELLIVTNNHVIADADELKVQFIDSEEVSAQVKGTDSPKDLAVIAVQLKDIKSSTLSNISIAKLGDSDSLQVGEGVIAIGNALGYGQSVTTGVVSAVNREVDVEGVAGTFIQTDAAINPGNSGGALLNMSGQVIGINSNKIGGTVVEGMGYAIPISSARPIIEDLMTKTTRVKVEDEEKGFLGISGVNVTDDAVNVYGMPKGVMIAQVYQGSAAEKAGLVKGNIITKFDGSSISTMEELQKILGYYAAGTTVDLTVMEGSPDGWAEKTVQIMLGAQQREEAQ
ncbi:MAG: trypsin-like serine protease [Clostridiales bacterium]|nr:trypsin-like serine protease [Clostridiales bacterium]